MRPCPRADRPPAPWVAAGARLAIGLVVTASLVGAAQGAVTLPAAAAQPGLGAPARCGVLLGQIGPRSSAVDAVLGRLIRERCRATAAPQVRYRYRLDATAGTRAEREAFAVLVAGTLGDPRGWALKGAIRFLPAGDDADLRVVLAAPDQVAAAADGCGARYSCRVGDDVYINLLRWREATPSFLGDGRSVEEYRRYVVLHEVGHWLGLGHVDCPGPGEPAPVMAQQSISLDGCRSQVWPLPDERTLVARIHLGQAK